MTIEVAHLYIDDHLTYNEIRYHADMCMDYLNLMEDPHRAIVMLVDDQKIKHKDRANVTLPVIGYLLKALPIDYVCFETDLRFYTDDWCAQQKDGIKIKTHLKRYNGGNPQCSHYIAIWYLLRFGRIADEHKVMLPVSTRAMLGNVPSYDEEKLTSILPSTYKSVEDDTQAELLDNLIVPLPEIRRYYYGPDNC